jgi:hypothetical protein
MSGRTIRRSDSIASCAGVNGRQTPERRRWEWKSLLRAQVATAGDDHPFGSTGKLITAQFPFASAS